MHEIHRRISAHFEPLGVEFKKYYYSPHLPASNHPTRKPNPGMLEEGIKNFDVDISQSWMVGDRMTDVEAGHRAGMKSVFLKGTEDPAHSDFPSAEFIAENFMELATFIGG